KDYIIGYAFFLSENNVTLDIVFCFNLLHLNTIIILYFY
ncbi:MAG: hypothetical protein ACJAUH_001721, partial [Saprospiraceae bacterium]